MHSERSREREEGTLDTFPKWLRHHAQARPGRPAFRLKDRGIWRTWTWAQAYDEVRALAQGLPGSASARATRSRWSARTGRRFTWASPPRRCWAPFRCRSTPTPSPTKWPTCSKTPASRFARRAGPGAGRQDPFDRRSPAAARRTFSTTRSAACATTTIRACARSTR